jgi:glutathione S-transferase
MVFKLHGVARSGCAQRVLVVLKEKNVPYELIRVDYLAKEHKGPAYLANQPFGQMPYIDDDGFILFESRAICKYIAQKYRNSGTPLIPDEKDLKATALFEQASSVEQNNFNAFVVGIIEERFGKP